jgi:hypothetical protein
MVCRGGKLQTELRMDNKEKVEKSVFDLVEGVTPVDQSTLEQYERKMTEEVIPDIVRTVEQRRLFAAVSRLKQLK